MQLAFGEKQFLNIVALKLSNFSEYRVAQVTQTRYNIGLKNQFTSREKLGIWTGRFLSEMEKLL